MDVGTLKMALDKLDMDMVSGLSRIANEIVRLPQEIVASIGKGIKDAVVALAPTGKVKPGEREQAKDGKTGASEGGTDFSHILRAIQGVFSTLPGTLQGFVNNIKEVVQNVLPHFAPRQAKQELAAPKGKAGGDIPEVLPAGLPNVLPAAEGAEGAAAAGGAEAGGMGAGAAGGPVGIAVAAAVLVALAISKATKAAIDFAFGVDKANRQLAEFSPTQGLIAAQAEIREVFRNMEIGEKTSSTSAALSQSIQDLLDNTKEIRIFIMNVLNAGLGVLIDGVNTLLSPLNYLADTMPELLEGMLRLSGLLLGPIGFAIINIALDAKKTAENTRKGIDGGIGFGDWLKDVNEETKKAIANNDPRFGPARGR